MSNKPVNSTGLRPEKRPTSTTSPSTDPGLATKSAPRPADQPIVSIGSVPRSVIISLGLLALAFVWTYWTTWLRLVHAWNVEPDYSHGYFVVPLALFFLWLRKDRMPQPHGPNWAGLALVFAGLSLHIVGSLYYLEPFNGWSMVVWLTGAAWLLGGREFCQWCLPSALFLVFMVPLPYSIEIMFRQPLQRIATEVSCWMLQSLGLPALAAGNVVAINDMELEVAQACSGLRIFVSIVALAFAYAVIVRRPWWIKALIFASALPIAVVANAVARGTGGSCLSLCLDACLPSLGSRSGRLVCDSLCRRPDGSLHLVSREVDYSGAATIETGTTARMRRRRDR